MATGEGSKPSCGVGCSEPRATPVCSACPAPACQALQLRSTGPAVSTLQRCCCCRYGHYLSLPGLRGFWSKAGAGRASFKAQEPAGGSGSEQLRLVQLLAPALVGRAKVFGNTLALRPDMVCEDMPYFDAPGTGVAPLGLERCAPTAMPEVRAQLCSGQGCPALVSVRCLMRCNACPGTEPYTTAADEKAGHWTPPLEREHVC
jgi:hypothetical protein